MKINSYKNMNTSQPAFGAYFNKNSYKHVERLLTNSQFYGFSTKEDAYKLVDKFKKNLPNHELEILDVKETQDLEQTLGKIPTGDPVEHLRFEKDYDYSGFAYVRTWTENDPELRRAATVLTDSKLDKKVQYTIQNNTTGKIFLVSLDEKHNNMKALYDLFNQNSLLFFSSPDISEARKIAEQQRMKKFIKNLADKLTTKTD